jgi:hypothetical protein
MQKDSHGHNPGWYISVLVGEPPVRRFLGHEFSKPRVGDILKFGVPKNNPDRDILSPSFYAANFDSYGDSYSEVM